jgi:outer membrane protein assembly factor BamB
VDVANWEVAVEDGVGAIALCTDNEGEPANVIIATARGHATCYQGATGARVWSYRSEWVGVGTNRAGTPVCLAVAGGKVFLPVGNQMDVLDAATGDRLGSVQGMLPVVSVASDGGKAFFTLADSLNAYCLYGMTTTWSFPESGEVTLQPMQHLATQYADPAWVPRIGPPSVSESHLVFVDGQAVYGVSRRGELEWRTSVMEETSGSESGEPTPIRLLAQTADGKGVVVHGRCVDLYGGTSGKLVTRIPFDSEVDDVIVLKSHLLVSERGRIHCLRGISVQDR